MNTGDKVKHKTISGFTGSIVEMSDEYENSAVIKSDYDGSIVVFPLDDLEQLSDEEEEENDWITAFLS